MSHTIRGGPRGQDFGAGREGTRVGRAPQGPGGSGSNFDRGDRTSVGRAPQAPQASQAPQAPTSSPTPSLPEAPPPSEAPKTGIYNFVQDGLELQDDVRPWDTEPGVFEAQEREDARPTSDRTRARDRQGRAAGSFDEARDPDSARSTSERPRVRSRGEDGEARADGRPRGPRTEDSPRGTSERPRVRSRSEDGAARADGRPRGPRTEDGPRGTAERPRVRSRGEDGEARTGNRARLPRGEDGMRPDRPPTRSRPALDPRLDKSAAPKTGERGALPQKPETPKTGERGALPQKPVVKQPQVPAGSLLGPELAPGAPEGTGEAKPLEDLVPLFSEAIDQESLAHHFKEELGFLGMDLRAAQLPRSTRAQRIWAFFVAYAEANAKNPESHTVKGKELFQAALQEHGFAELQDPQTGKDGVAVAMELLEAKTPEELQQKLANVHMEARPEPVRTEVPSQPQTPASPPQAETPRPDQPAHASTAIPQRTERQPGATPSKFDQAEPEKVMAAQLQPAHIQGTPPPPLPGMLQRIARQGEPTPEDLYGLRDRRGTNKKMGSHMLWNVLHKFRDSPEDDAVKREQWSQLAFGAIVVLVGAFLMVVILASL